MLKSGEEYLVIFRWNGLKELCHDESFTARNVKEIMSEHDFSILELKISNFVKLEIRPSFKENNYVWYVAAKDVCQNYGMYVPVTSVPNTEEGKLNFLLSQDSQLEKMYEIKISNCNIHKNDEGSWDVILNCVQMVMGIVVIYVLLYVSTIVARNLFYCGALIYVILKISISLQ